MKKNAVNSGSIGGQAAGEAVIEAVENQLEENNPPAVQETLSRLIAEGESRKNAMRHIAGALVIEIFGALKKNEPYNEERYIRNLSALPKPPRE